VGAALAPLIASIFALGTLSGCQCNRTPAAGEDTQAATTGAARASDPAPAMPQRADVTKLDLGQAPLKNPLNLYDVEIAGSPDYETVGTIDGVRVTMQDLEAQSVGAFGRIAERLYAARDQGWRWLIERVALEEQARAVGAPLIPFLLTEYARLPAPTDADLAAIESQVSLAALDATERRAAATSLWRFDAWQRRRAELILAGRANVPFERVRRQISTPEYADPSTVIAHLQGEPITRAELRVLSGYQAALARHEYWRIARMQFDKYVDAFLLAREAEHLGVTEAEVERLEVERMPPPTDAEVRTYMAENPEYAQDPQGVERARDNLRRLREVGARQTLLDRLRAASVIQFFLKEPEFERYPVEVPAPRWHGPLAADDVVVAFHAVGCPMCARGSQLLQSVLDARPGKLKLLAGDYFESGASVQSGAMLDPYRGALALHCAPPDSRDALLKRLAGSFGDAKIATLVSHAEASGIDAAPFRACMESDRLLPLIVENLAMAERLGLERSIPGIFVNGVRIGDLKDLAAVLEQIDAALAKP
jgi:protein-disulfide isomerase